MTLIDRAFRAVMVFTIGACLLRIAEVRILFKLHALFLGASAGMTMERTALHDAVKSSGRLLPFVIIVFVAYLASLSAFTYVAYRGLVAAGVPHLRFSPASAALLYFLPVWNLVHLFMVMQELFRASQYDATKADWLDWREEERSVRISAAWLFIVGGILFDTVGTVFLSRLPEPYVFVVVLRIRMITSFFAMAALWLYLEAIASIADRVNSLVAGAGTAYGSGSNSSIRLPNGSAT